MCLRPVLRFLISENLSEMVKHTVGREAGPREVRGQDVPMGSATGVVRAFVAN
jgi:hypothetical protein